MIPGLVLLAATAGNAQAPTPNAASQPAAPEPVALADQPYVDASFGFSIRPFRDCTVVRHKRMDSDGDVELAQFSQPQRGWIMTIRLARTSRMFNPDDLLSGLAEKLTAQYPEMKILAKDKLRLAGRDAVRLAATVPLGSTLWFRQQTAIFYRQNEFFVIVLNVPAADRDVAEKLFAEITRSFEIIRSEMTQELLQQALARGTELLRSIAQDRKLGARLVHEHYLRILVDGKDSGYLWLREMRLAVDRRDGVGLRQEGWLFDADGNVRRQLTEMFLSDDMTAERWNTTVDVISPARGTSPARKLTTLEQGVRDGDKLLVAFSRSPNSTEMSDKVVEIPESYAPGAVFTLFPRIADLGRPGLYAFVSFNSERQGLVLRTLRIVEGRQNLTIDGRRISATRIEDSEGLIPPVSEIYVDDAGQLARIVAGNIEMLATTLEKLRPLYAQKIADTEKLVRQIVRPPGAAPGAKKPAPGAKNDKVAK